jgi:hypothetical protein
MRSPSFRDNALSNAVRRAMLRRDCSACAIQVEETGDHGVKGNDAPSLGNRQRLKARVER